MFKFLSTNNLVYELITDYRLKQSILLNTLSLFSFVSYFFILG